MSWNDYITNLCATGHVDKAAIVGPNGSVWAASAGLKIDAKEIAAIASGWPNFSASGVKILGEKYMFLRGDDSCVLIKKGATGAAIGKTKSAFVVGFHNDKQQIGNCNKEVMKIVDYLVEAGY